MDSGAWWATVCGVAKSGTGLTDWLTNIFTFIQYLDYLYSDSDCFLNYVAWGENVGGKVKHAETVSLVIQISMYWVVYSSTFKADFSFFMHH